LEAVWFGGARAGGFEGCKAGAAG